jgi:hypothetical protein
MGVYHEPYPVGNSCEVVTNPVAFFRRERPLQNWSPEEPDWSLGVPRGAKQASYAGLWALRELPWRDAARVDAAIYASRARAKVPLPQSPVIQPEVRLKFRAVVRLGAYPFERTLTVWWIVRR